MTKSKCQMKESRSKETEVRLLQMQNSNFIFFQASKLSYLPSLSPLSPLSPLSLLGFTFYPAHLGRVSLAFTFLPDLPAVKQAWAGSTFYPARLGRVKPSTSPLSKTSS
ncbi:MAG: hypothetical protein ACOCUF_01910 [Patescibacteria group bacterium]